MCLRAAFLEVRSRTTPLTVRTRARPMDGGVRITGVVTEDPLGLVREVRVSGRADTGPVVRGAGEATVRTVAQRVHYWAVAIGPGGAEIATAGTEDEPLVWEADERLVVVESSGPPWWIWAAGGVAVVAVTVLVVVLLSADGGIQPSRPMELP